MIKLRLQKPQLPFRNYLIIAFSILSIIAITFVSTRFSTITNRADAQASPTPVANCYVYAVHEITTSQSQFFVVNTVAKTKTLIGSAYNNDVFEDLDIDPSTKILYSFANNGASSPYSISSGHLYRIDSTNGKAFDVGDANTSDVEAISFRPGDTTNIWFWEEQDGLYRINKTNVSGKTKVKSSPNSDDFQGMTWNNDGSKLYLSTETGHFWQYDPSTNNMTDLASNMGTDNDSMNMRPDGHIMSSVEGSGTNITLFAYDPIAKAKVGTEDIIINAAQYDFEGLVWPDWCGNPKIPSTPTPIATPTPTAAPQPPTFTSFTFTCTPSNGMTTPYKLTAAAITNAKGTAKIAKNYVVIAPTYSGTRTYTYTAGTGVVSGSYTNTSVNVASYTTVAPSNTYTVSSTSLPANLTSPTFSFNVDFQSNNAFFQTFSSGYDIYMYIEDSNGRNNLGGGTTLPKVVADYNFDSSTSCGKVYYSTLGGNYRSNEPGAYSGQSGLSVTYGVQGNKVWQTKNSGNTSYGTYDSEVGSDGFPYTSNFTYEAPTSLSTSSTTANSNFNVLNINSTSPVVRRETIMNSFALSLDESVNLGKIQKYSYKTFLGAGAVEAPATNKITLTLGSLAAAEGGIIEVTDATNTFRTLEIIDTDTSGPNNIIIWCKLVACKMTVNAIKTVSTVTLDTSTKKMSYDKTGLQTVTNAKSRIYLNYLAGEASTTPIEASQSYSGGTIPATRTIKLIQASSTANNYYLGAFMTNGYLFSGQSTNTDIIKGFVIARGVVANATNNGTGNMYFKNFPNPFLLIDFDAKYSVEFAGSLASNPADTKFKYLGF
jgi:hypothetical protein